MEDMEVKVVEMDEKMVKLQKVLDQEKVKKVEAINKLADVSNTLETDAQSSEIIANIINFLCFDLIFHK